MKKVIKQIQLWFIERAVSGTAWDFFLIGLVGLLGLTLIGLFTYYV